MRRLPDTVVYFVRSEAAYFKLEPVYRQFGSGSEAQLRSAFQALVAGPNPSEASRGLFSSVPEDTQLLNLTVQGNSLTVNVSKAFVREDGLANLQGRIHQLFYTLSQPATIERVFLQVEGEPLTILGGEGLMLAYPWQRQDNNFLPQW